MDKKREEEFNIEVIESIEEDDEKINIHLEPILKLEEIQERNCFGSIDMKSEIEVKEEPFDIVEEETTNDGLSDNNFRLDQNQIFINAAEGEEEDSQTKSTSRSSSHWAVMHQKIINKNNHLENLSCGYCNFRCKTEDELKRHLKRHRKIKHKCPHCSYQSTSKSYLNRHHLVTHCNTKLFKCSHCSFECNHEGNLRRHMLTHANNKLFKCSDCSYECNEKGSLEKHLLTHANVKLFKCSDCSYECNRKSNLEIYMLTHNTNSSISRSHRAAVLHQQYIKKNYVENHLSCKYCSFSCKSKNELKTHLKTHNREIKHKCTHCSFECNFKSNLESHHLLTHRNRKLFKCSQCSYECNWNSNLKKHMLTHAKIVPKI